MWQVANGLDNAALELLVILNSEFTDLQVEKMNLKLVKIIKIV